MNATAQKPGPKSLTAALKAVDEAYSREDAEIDAALEDNADDIADALKGMRTEARKFNEDAVAKMRDLREKRIKFRAETEKAIAEQHAIIVKAEDRISVLQRELTETDTGIAGTEAFIRTIEARA